MALGRGEKSGLQINYKVTRELGIRAFISFVSFSFTLTFISSFICSIQFNHRVTNNLSILFNFCFIHFYSLLFCSVSKFFFSFSFFSPKHFYFFVIFSFYSHVWMLTLKAFYCYIRIHSHSSFPLCCSFTFSPKTIKPLQYKVPSAATA